MSNLAAARGILLVTSELFVKDLLFITGTRDHLGLSSGVSIAIHARGYGLQEVKVHHQPFVVVQNHWVHVSVPDFQPEGLSYRITMIF